MFFILREGYRVGSRGGVVESKARAEDQKDNNICWRRTRTMDERKGKEFNRYILACRKCKTSSDFSLSIVPNLPTRLCHPCTPRQAGSSVQRMRGQVIACCRLLAGGTRTLAAETKNKSKQFHYATGCSPCFLFSHFVLQLMNRKQPPLQQERSRNGRIRKA